MKIKNLKKLKNNRYQIFFEDNTNIILYDDVILSKGLLLKKDVSKNEMIELIKENKKLESYYDAIKYITRKQRVSKEVRNYLLTKKYDLENINHTIKLLEERKLINPSLYLNSFIHDEIVLTNHGPNKIKKKLLDLDFSLEEIDEELTKINEDIWKEKLTILINKKIATNRKESWNALKEKIVYYFFNEGYAKDMINKIIDNTEIPNNTGILEKEAEKLYKKLSLKYQDNNLFYQLKGRLLNKGFNYQEIDNVIEKLKTKF